MSDNRKYYYMRIKEDFYDSEEIKLLQAMNEGYLFSDILMKMYLKSLKNEGRLMFKEHIPYDDKMIATITGHSNSVVEKALVIFQQLGLIEVLDSGAIYMLDIQAYIGKSSTEADRKKEYRNRIKREKDMLLKSNGQMSEQVSGQTPLEIETEKELEKETEIKKEQMSSLSDEFCSYVVKLGFTLDSELGQALSNDIKEFGLKEVKNAISIAASKGKNYSYAKAILNNRQAEGKIKKRPKTFVETDDVFLKSARELMEEENGF